MKHLSDDQLALYHYRDGDDIEVAGWHLTSCAECRSRLAAIEEVLKLVVAPSVPARGPDYGSEVWNRIRAELPELATREHWWPAIPRWAWAGAVAVLLVGVFLLGRYSSERQSLMNVATDAGCWPSGITWTAAKCCCWSYLTPPDLETLMSRGDDNERSNLPMQIVSIGQRRRRSAIRAS